MARAQGKNREAFMGRRGHSTIVVGCVGLCAGSAIAFLILGTSRVASSGEPALRARSPMLTSLTAAAERWDPDNSRQVFRAECRPGSPSPCEQDLPVPAPAHRSADLLPAGEVRCFTGHTGVVTGVGFAAGGRWIVSGSQDGTLRVWDVQTGHELRRLEGHTTPIHGIAVSPDGTRALSAGGAYDLQGGVKTALDCTVRLWDLETGNELRRLIGHAGPVNCVAFSPDGRLAVSGSHDQTVCVWDLERGERLLCLEGHGSGVHGIAFSPDGRHILSAGGCDHSVRVWDLQEGKEIAALAGHVGDVENVAVAAGGRLALAASGGQEVIQGRARAVDCTVRLWDLGEGRELRRFDGHRGAVYGVALCADEHRVVTGSLDGSLRVWDVETGHELAQLTGHADGIWCVAVSASGDSATSGSADCTVRLWRLPGTPRTAGGTGGS